MDYSGKIINKNEVVPTQTSASGVWSLQEAAAATKNNTWPVALVPNPISKSLRFNSADSAYLNRTPASATNQKTWTWSGWVKRSTLSVRQGIFVCSNAAGNDYVGLEFLANDKLAFDSNNGSGTEQFRLETNAVFRDPSAWYHIVVFFNTTQATASNRAAIYINGVLQTYSTATYMPQNYDGRVNTTNQHNIGSWLPAVGLYFAGYITEVNFIDGQALTPSDFGLTNPQTGQWIPKKYTGTYGTNGFYLNFKDATSTTTLGYDYSGNANNWTTNNFSVTAGSGNDSLTDVPTPWVAYNTTGDVGGVVRGNYCTLNPLNTASAITLANGNLEYSTSTTTNVGCAIGTIGVSSGKWYWEGTPTSLRGLFGVSLPGTNIATDPAAQVLCYYYRYDGNKYNGSGSAYGASYTTNDVIGVALDLDAGTLTFYKNGVSQGTAFSSLPANTYFPLTGDDATSVNVSGIVNFGQRPFAYTPPAGFLSLCSTNLPTPTIGFGLTNQGDDYFNVALYTGNGSSQSITGVGFQPDLIWFKSRSTVANHALIDAVRGRSKLLFSSLTDAEATSTTTAKDLVSFDADGFTVGVPEQNGSINTNGTTNVAWNWKANGAGSSNTAGTITSTVSANTTAGFSIVTYTGDGTQTGKTVGHGLGVTPAMIIVKCRSETNNWNVWHKSLSSSTTSALQLSTTGAAFTDIYAWGSTAPTSSIFGVGTQTGVNVWTNKLNATFVAYAFAEVAGYSAFGSYTGNGSTDGPFVFCGFRPRYVMIKRTDSSTNGDWEIKDSSRSPYNVANSYLYANLANAEGTSSTVDTDFCSNGFKLRAIYTGINASGGTYIYAAFAESPFKFANAR